jgi:cytochrome P450
MPFVGKFLLPKAGDTSGFGKMMEACFDYVNERLANPTDKRHDMLESFMRHGLIGEDLRSEAVEKILAGSDTTAGAIRGTLLHIISNPRVYAKLQKEVDEAIHDGRAPSENTLISFTQTKKLPYLQAVIREGMRIWVPVAALLAKDVPSQGDTIDVDGTPVFLPGGTSIGYSAHSMFRRRDIFGEDSDVFRPERWFEEDAIKLEKMVETSELIFGHGKWKCLGKPVAQIEIGKVIFEVRNAFEHLFTTNGIAASQLRHYSY